MRYFFDFEFTQPLHELHYVPISLGIVAEDGRELYLINECFSREDSVGWLTSEQWVQDNVKPYLFNAEAKTRNASLHRTDWHKEIREFIGDDPAPQFFGWYCTYDFFLLCELFGGFMDFPYKPQIAYDLRVLEGVFGFDFEEKGCADYVHNALLDARDIARKYKDFENFINKKVN